MRFIFKAYCIEVAHIASCMFSSTRKTCGSFIGLFFGQEPGKKVMKPLRLHTLGVKSSRIYSDLKWLVTSAHLIDYIYTC